MSDTDVFGQIGAAAATARGNDEYWSKKRDDTKAEEARAAVYDSANNEIPGSTAIAAPGAPAVGGVHGALNSVAHHIEAFAKKLWDGGLNDAHVPNGQQAVAAPPSTPVPSSPDASAPPAGIPSAGAGASPAPPPVAGAPSPGATTPGASSPAIPTGLATAPPRVQKAAVAAVTDPASNQGKPQAPPPHSMSHYDYDHMDKLAYTAAAAAERSGQDGAKVLESLHTVRTSFIQSGILKNITAANAALMIGDQKSLEQAMKNVNYYLPNGQDLEMHKGPDGVLQYRDPFAPPGADGQQPWVDVTTQHIQLMSQNAMDPTKVQGIINDARLQGSQAEYRARHGQAELNTSEASLGNSRASESRAGSARALVPSQEHLNMARATALRTTADAAAVRAAGASKGMVTPAAASAAADKASKAAEAAQQGIMETNTNENSRAYGMPMRNNAKIPWWYAGQDGKTKLGPADLAGSQSFASQLGAANVGMGASAIAEIAGKIYHNQHIKRTTHKGDDGKQQNDVLMFPDSNQIGYWVADKNTPNGGRLVRINAYPQLIDDMRNGVDQSAPFQNIFEPAAGADVGFDPADNPADKVPAIEPPQVMGD